MTSHTPSSKAALRGEPSYVWRAGQVRRLDLMCAAAGERIHGRVLVDGCGVGAYLSHLAPEASTIVGLDIELERTHEAQAKAPKAGLVCGAGEHLPFPDASFDFLLSHEVLEHVQNDAEVIREMVRVLRPGGRLALFCPNRGYPFETHGIYWRGRYHFGNIPLVNWLPRHWRDRLAPHVEVYTSGDLEGLFNGLPVRFVQRTILFGAYDNIIARAPALGRALRAVLQALEYTPLRFFGLSHFWVVEKV
ncbi:protein containg methyltransferase domain [Longilinea arvoryzae]|uniref:Protein containg methyltransferase domain n=1 Tax=Longilinea arvoryzae TaxID=360412 RepID=A0A0S7BHC9_9CHLR|nr:class I SAM-dependent methyltransferase [Longilinea arvoryzae]GAP12890.1 protein containg methyltransferase domain [Longilinea arvoryzae]